MRIIEGITYSPYLDAIKRAPKNLQELKEVENF